MPELPEVEGVVRSLAPAASGRTIQKVTVSETVTASKAAGKEAIVKGHDVDYFAEELKGFTIEAVTRRSKYIYFHLVKNNTCRLLVSHLGMTGAWFVVNTIQDIREQKFRNHIHAIFQLEDGGLLVYSDIRRFGELRLLTCEEDYIPLTLMAPEPFAEDALEFFLTKSVEEKYARKPIKEVIMDGQVISGCGNIYATEALFRVGIHPKRATGRISHARKQQLFREIVAVLDESIQAGGSSISDYRNTNGEAGSMQNRLKMYGKKVCPNCGTATASIQIANRTSTYCKKCQH
ncbi:bifunctional DNA-formamidopyrimidine glycosylase/DNA-(apurinic or apyrimidinic site) lyase [Sporosarcina aquimarina]|uniref:Formamidopyrimidine-DNA glycosylase n=1 Tax=Sporosarcina aquimarina TaxID=114975 RepID=A0ABU4G098_9BACL|nr:bifunctional DNA-formamidopyrimidine glycosylase/DNA-(apurinic or apyrimidinic site) lyase [Sporosarcina aquimarina]MDW0110373.1 bifunctional DNA-formamidopyrimidine glycosylase/DNA-(apurinic or apyrimidinic site) lyase [Sporosarcina aquimarina]